MVGGFGEPPEANECFAVVNGVVGATDEIGVADVGAKGDFDAKPADFDDDESGVIGESVVCLLF